MYSRGWKRRDAVLRKPQILCVHMEPSRLMRISLIAGSLGIAVKEVKEDQWGQRLEALFGLKPCRLSGGKQQIDGEMIVAAFFGGDLLDDLYMNVRKNGMNMPLTAMLTPANRSWTCERLYRELRKEASILNGR